MLPQSAPPDLQFGLGQKLAATQSGYRTFAA
jgi:hypothetical protein